MFNRKFLSEKKKKALHFKFSNGPIPVLVVSKVDS